jgi:hypothetical protein
MFTIMQFTFVLFFFPYLLAQRFATAQTTLPDYCTDGTANANFSQCIFANIGTCVDCIHRDYFANNTNITTCANLTDSVCPNFRCCSECEAETEKFYECFIFPDNTIIKPELQSCSFNCSAFPNGDNPNGVVEPCDTEYASWVACTAIHYESCLNCFIDDNQTFSNGSNICADEQQYFCFVVECCPSCQSEWTAYHQCEIKSSNSTAVSNCQLSCNGGVEFSSNQSLTNGGTTSGGSTSGGTSSGGSNTGGSTSGGSTSGGTTSGGSTNGGSSTGGPTSRGSTTGGPTQTGTKSAAPKNADSTFYFTLASVVASVSAAVYLN